MKSFYLFFVVFLLVFNGYTNHLNAQCYIQITHPLGDTTILPGDSVQLISHGSCSDTNYNITWSHGVSGFDGGWVSPAITTTYSVFILGLSGNSASESVTIYVDGTVGMNGSLLSGFSLARNYPNPACQQTTIDFKVPHYGEAKIEVVDITGRLMYGNHITVDAGDHSINLDVSSYSPGVYTYILVFEGYRLTRKMMVQ